MDKETKYSKVEGRCTALVSGEKDFIANCANVIAELHATMGFLWTGVYRVIGDQLVLGPFQGPPACTRIKFGKGVCGSAWEIGRSILVPDVDKYPGHIRCSSRARSEVVAPIRRNGEIIGVLDIDSDVVGGLDGIDLEHLGKIADLLSGGPDDSLKEFIEKEILPHYDCFDKGHRRDHAMTVIRQGQYLAGFYDVDPDIVYVACACHDLGLREDRKTHHLVSGRIIRKELPLSRWFTPEEIEMIAIAAEDHRASAEREPRSIYGKIVAEADRQIDTETVIRRTIQFGLKNFPDLDKEEQWQRTLEHLEEKYAEGGYLKLWIPESPNAARLEELRSVIRDRERLRTIFERLYSEETEPAG